MKYTVQEEIKKNFLDRAVQLLKEDKTFIFVLDNIAWDVKVHDMRSDQENRSVHAVASSMVFDRISSSNIPDRFAYSVCSREPMHGRILCESFPAFNYVLPAQTVCQYSAEMRTQSVAGSQDPTR